MTVLCAWKFTEAARSRLCLIVAVFNWVAIALSLILMFIGVYIKIAISKFTHMVENYHGDALPILLMLMGFVTALTNCCGGFVLFLAHHPSDREKFITPLITYVITSIIVCLFIFAGGVMCYTDIENLHEAFRNGLAKAMEKYKDHQVIKERMDRLQMKFRCCGNTDYSDWFHVAWIDEKFINTQSEEVKSKTQDGYRTDDVPFSCCDPAALRPCITHSVEGKHEAYDHTVSVTLYRNGCKDALMDFFGDKLLTKCGILIFIIVGLQILLSLLARYLQTSMATAVALNDPRATSHGYLFLCGDLDDKASKRSNSCSTRSAYTARMEEEDENTPFNYEEDYEGEEMMEDEYPPPSMGPSSRAGPHIEVSKRRSTYPRRARSSRYTASSFR